MTQNDNVVVRIPPSPTGFLHVGTARTVLFNYLFAKQHGGKVILRSEDTDKERSKKEYEDDIIDNLKWLGFEFDEFHRQSERTDRYKAALEKMIASGAAYISKEEPKEGEENKRSEVIRFKNPGGPITFTDMIRGEITFDVTELGDFVIAKSLEEPLYHLAVVVDDIDMGITHIIRGDDHISNTPRQILLVEALGGTRSLYAHLPLILAPDRSKLSKRKHGESVSIKHYREAGYLKEAIINFLALLGWNPGTEQELFTFDELIKTFKIEQVQKGGAIFNVEKLNWINKEYIKKLPVETILAEVKKELPDAEEAILNKLAPIVLDRIEKFSDIHTMNEAGEFAYYFNKPHYEASQLLWKTDPKENAIIHLTKTAELLSAVDDESFNNDIIKDTLWTYASEVGKGNVLWPLRMALSGKDKSPDPFTLADILGKKETIARIQDAIKTLS